MPEARKSPGPLAGGDRAGITRNNGAKENTPRIDLDQVGQRNGKYAALSRVALFDTRLSDREVRILAAFASYASDGGYCYPAIGTVAARLGISRRTVERALAILEEAGYLVRYRQKRLPGRGGGWSVNGYLLLYPAPPESVEANEGQQGSGNQLEALSEQQNANEAMRHLGVASVGDNPSHIPPSKASDATNLANRCDKNGQPMRQSCVAQTTLKESTLKQSTLKPLAREIDQEGDLLIPDKPEPLPEPKAASKQEEPAPLPEPKPEPVYMGIYRRLTDMGCDAGDSWSFLIDCTPEQYDRLARAEDLPLLEAITEWKRDGKQAIEEWMRCMEAA